MSNEDFIDIKLGVGCIARIRKVDALTQAELRALLTERFGDSPGDWAFVCPNCGDIATGADFRSALAEHPKTRSNGDPVVASDILGQQCIGRTLGALVATKVNYTGRGCDWAAGGLFSGPCYVLIEGEAEQHWAPCFRPASTEMMKKES